MEGGQRQSVRGLGAEAGSEQAGAHNDLALGVTERHVRGPGKVGYSCDWVSVTDEAKLRLSGRPNASTGRAPEDDERGPDGDDGLPRVALGREEISILGLSGGVNGHCGERS
jgi:hypothetical protein